MSGDGKKSKGLIIFDLVATLTDAGPRYATAFSKVCEDFGCQPPPADEVLSMLGNKNLKQITDHFAGFLDPDQKRKFMESCNTTCDTLLYDIHWIEHLYPGVREALADLVEQGYTLGIFTGTREDALDSQLNYHNIRRHFDERYIRAKNNQRDGADISSEALKERQLSSIVADYRRDNGSEGNVIVVGDSVSDFIAARDAGLSFIGFAANEDKKKTFLSADVPFLVESFAEIPGIMAVRSAQQPSSSSFPDRLLRPR